MKKYLSALCATVMVMNLTACGTILYPERSGQTKGGKLDVGVVLLDGVGLLFFLVPGVIAYAVDFSNGTIYLPAGQSSIDDVDTTEMTAIKVGKENLTKEKVEAIVSANVGRDVDVSAATVYKIDADGQKVKVDNEAFM